MAPCPMVLAKKLACSRVVGMTGLGHGGCAWPEHPDSEQVLHLKSLLDEIIQEMYW